MRLFNTFFGLYATRETIFFIKMWSLKTFEFEIPDLGTVFRPLFHNFYFIYNLFDPFLSYLTFVVSFISWALGTLPSLHFG